MSFRLKIYNFLVNRHSGIQERYHRKRDTAKGKAGHVTALFYLIWLNIAFYLFGRKELGHPEKYPYYESKKLEESGSESSLSKRKSPQEFARELSGFDVISFDVFDTLILRPFARPTDLFYAIGDRLSYPDFRNIRIQSEAKARKVKQKKEGHSEVTLEEIYEVLLEETGLTLADAAHICPQEDIMSDEAANSTYKSKKHSDGTDISSEGNFETCQRNEKAVCASYESNKLSNGANNNNEDISDASNFSDGKSAAKEAAAIFARAEVATEIEFCFVNPYMLPVVMALKEAGKHIIVTSDMYLKSEYIKRILAAAGYPEFNAYYSSCETIVSKSTGALYDLVKECEGKAYAGNSVRFAHVGDNKISDIEHAKMHGFTPYYTKNINLAGMHYRPDDMSEITGSIYRGIVNAHIHNGLNAFSAEYEYGYIYGGLFVTGYCRFIHDYVKAHNIDKILFLARDGDILKKVYNKLYPEETNTCYVYWSRLAAAKMAAGRFKNDYFRRFLYHKVNQGITLEKIFESMELTWLLERLCGEGTGKNNAENTAAAAKKTESDTQTKLVSETGVEQAEDKAGKYTPSTRLTDKNVDDIKNFIMENWQEVLASYEDQVRAGGIYYDEILASAKSAVAVDIGWAGSGAITLNYMVNSVWGLNCRITGIIAGTNTCTNAEPDFSETFLQSGKLVSYLYSQRENRDIWKFHDTGKNHNLYLETLLDSPEGSLKGFYMAPAGIEIRFKEPLNDKDKVLKIQRGILDFADQWKSISEKAPDLCGISGRDAYAPFIIMESPKNKNFTKNITKMFDEAGI